MNENDRLAWDFFRKQTVVQLPGSFPSAGWLQTALQLSLQEEPIFQAMAAIGSVHRSHQRIFHASWDAVTDRSLKDQGLRQYSKAISSLQQFMNRDGALPPQKSTEVVILACVLFVCYEVLQETAVTAVAHLRSGRRIIEQYGGFDGSRSDPESARLALSSTRSALLAEVSIVFDALNRDYVDADHSWQCPRPTLIRPHSTVGIPEGTAFTSVAAASAHLNTLVSVTKDIRRELLRVVKDHSPSLDMPLAEQYCLDYCKTRTVDLTSHNTLSVRISDAVKAHKVWLSAFDCLGKNSDEIDSRHAMRARTLHFVSHFTISTCRDTRERLCDAWNDKFLEVLNLAEEYLALPSEPSLYGPQYKTPEYKPQRTFALGTSLLPAIYLIAIKCRESRIRRRAIGLLSTANRQEGVSHSGVLAAFAQRIAEIEERQVAHLGGHATAAEDLRAEQIPEEARFCDVVIVPAVKDQLSMAKLIMARYAHESNGEVQMIEERCDLMTQAVP